MTIPLQCRIRRSRRYIESYRDLVTLRIALRFLLAVFVVIGGVHVLRVDVARPRNVTALIASARVSFPLVSPTSVSFDSTTNGWVLGTEPCGTKDCLTLVETSNRARTWSTKSLPAPLLADADRTLGGTTAAIYGAASLNVRFANQNDGWIYGTLPGKVPPGGVDLVGYGPILWSTHDGGRSWRRVRLDWMPRDPSVFDLEAAHGTVYAETMNRSYLVTLSSSPVGEDHWRVVPTQKLYLPAGGGEPSGAIVLSGSSGWLVAGNDRGVSASLRLTTTGTWTTWTQPCGSVGNSYVVPAASSSLDLVVVCQMGGFGYSLSPSAPPGATLGSNWLYLSSNGGLTFHSGDELEPRNSYFDGVLASPTPGVVVMSRGPGGVDNLMASFNGGRTWHVVYLGEPTFLSFTNSTQGVALIEHRVGDDSMIMTFDGGRTWRLVDL